MLEISAKNGFQYVSMGFGSSKCFHHDDWAEETVKIKTALDALGLRCVMTHAPYYDLRISADFLDDAMETALLRCVKATSMLGGEIMAIHPRGYYRDEGPVPENGFTETARKFLKNLSVIMCRILPLWWKKPYAAAAGSAWRICRYFQAGL